MMVVAGCAISSRGYPYRRQPRESMTDVPAEVGVMSFTIGNTHHLPMSLTLCREMTADGDR